MGILNRLAAKGLVRSQAVILKRIKLADKAIALCDANDMIHEAQEWRVRRANHINRFSENHLKIAERAQAEAAEKPNSIDWQRVGFVAFMLIVAIIWSIAQLVKRNV